MRQIVAFNRVSADGYFSASDGNLDWVVQDDDVYKTGQKGMPEADTVIFGRRTYDMFESFWPKVLQDPSGSVPDPHGGKRSPEMRDMAVWLTEARKLVFSTSRKGVSWNNAHLVREFDPKAIERMKQEPGKAMLVFGSGSIASLLTQHGLIDEYVFVVGPVILGNGKQLLTGVPKQLKVELAEVLKHPTGNITLRYRYKR